MALPAIAVLSAAVLAYEVLLMRLFAIVQWHHFAYMVISIALLGYGVSGSVLTLARRWLEPRFAVVFAAAAALFGLTSLGAFALAQRLPFNVLAVVWEPRQLSYLLVLYVLFMVPFFCGASCVGLAFLHFRDRIGRVYRADLIGAGCGALAIIGLLFALTPSAALRVITGLALVAAALVLLDRSRSARLWWSAGLLLAALLLPLALPADWTELRPSPYKGLSQILQVPGTRVVAERSSPLGLLTAVRSDTIPFRHAPGLSLNNVVEPPAQIGVFTDADSLTPITAFDGRRGPLAYLDFATSALPYHLRSQPQVLVLGAGGGADVLQALYHGAIRIDAVELDPLMVDLVARTFSDFAGGLYQLPQVAVHIAEARHFVAASATHWDVIQIPLLDSFGAAAAGVHSLSESYVYTVEAFEDYLERLAPGGLLAITRWLKLPPRDSLKLFATALDALAASGAAAAADHLALIRGWATTTLLVSKHPLTAGERAAIRRFAAERSFDLAWLPDLTADQANRFNILESDPFFAATSALAGPARSDILARYKFDITATDDDRPYFFDFFRWRALPEMLSLRTQGGGALIEWGYPILFATLIQAAALSVVLILLPLWWHGLPGRGRGRILGYFAALGLAFLFVEIAFIQRFTLFLGHPLYAVAVVLVGFLVFAGLGSGLAPRLTERLGAQKALLLAVAGIAGLALVYLALLPPVFERLLWLPDAGRVAVTVLLIAPLGFCLGMPFPLGLARVSAAQPALVPWAWGINGCASVISAILAAILAIHFGFTIVVAAAVVLYLAAAALFLRPLASD